MEVWRAATPPRRREGRRQVEGWGRVEKSGRIERRGRPSRRDGAAALRRGGLAAAAFLISLILALGPPFSTSLRAQTGDPFGPPPASAGPMGPGAPSMAAGPGETLPYEEVAARRIAAFDAAALALEQGLADRRLTLEGLERARAAMARQRGDALEVVARLETLVSPFLAQIEALGPVPEGNAPEAPEVAQRRAALTERLTGLQGRLTEAQLAAARAEALEQALAERQRERRADQLFSKGPSLTSAATWRDAAADLGAASQALLSAGADAVAAFDARARANALGLAALAALALWIALMGRVRAAKAWLNLRMNDHAGETGAPPGVVEIVGMHSALSALRVGPILLLAGAGAAFAQAPSVEEPLRAALIRAAEGAAAVILIYALARVVFAPRLPDRRLLDLEDWRAWATVRQAVALAATVFGMRVLVDVAAAAGAGPAFETIVVALAAMIAAPLFLRLVSAMLAPPAASDASHEGHAAADPESDAEDEETDAGAGALLRALLKVLAIAVAVATPAAALLSFPELARFLIEKAAGTVVLLATAGLAYDTILRVIAAERGGESGAWAPLAIGLLVAAVLAPNLALLWGATAADLRAVFRVLFEGVEVDGARFGLFDVLAGIGIFLLGVTLTRLGQRGLRKSVLRQTRMDAGLQSSISAGIGYTGVLLSVLIAVSAVGLDLSSLALVAGALSVGIGFGLQAIVNNFVSGIVLLVERPIKSGDWIRVGEAEGYVRRINARSTLIEKFDKSTVIVPNSELVANQVTNLTHRNLAGRATIRIRASFDTDPARVIAIMEAVALSHESVLSYPQPLAMFRSVSDSGLEFELWAYLGNVNLVFNVHSDLMVMLWKRLREEGVEVPYPQTGLHVRSLPAAANGAAATASAVIAPPESAATLSRD